MPTGKQGKATSLNKSTESKLIAIARGREHAVIGSHHPIRPSLLNARAQPRVSSTLDDGHGIQPRDVDNQAPFTNGIARPQVATPGTATDANSEGIFVALQPFHYCGDILGVITPGYGSGDQLLV